MSKPYSEDLRERVVAAVEGGLSRRQAAGVFDVGVSTVIRWVQRFRATGSFAAKPMGGDHRSLLTGVRDWILERIEAEPDLTIEELQNELRERGAHLRQAKERTIPALYDRIGRALETFEPREFPNYFRNAGYAPA